MITTTFEILKKAGACESGYKKLAESLGGVRKYGKDRPIPLLHILESNGLDDMLWCADKTQQQKEADVIFRLMAAEFAESVLHIFEEKYPDDKKPRLAIKAAKDFANGRIDEQPRQQPGPQPGPQPGTQPGPQPGTQPGPQKKKSSIK